MKAPVQNGSLGFLETFPSDPFDHASTFFQALGVGRFMGRRSRQTSRVFKQNRTNRVDRPVGSWRLYPRTGFKITAAKSIQVVNRSESTRTAVSSSRNFYDLYTVPRSGSNSTNRWRPATKPMLRPFTDLFAGADESFACGLLAYQKKSYRLRERRDEKYRLSVTTQYTCIC